MSFHVISPLLCEGGLCPRVLIGLSDMSFVIAAWSHSGRIGIIQSPELIIFDALVREYREEADMKVYVYPV
jgi:hypothetical protein